MLRLTSFPARALARRELSLAASASVSSSTPHGPLRALATPRPRASSSPGSAAAAAAASPFSTQRRLLDAQKKTTAAAAEEEPGKGAAAAGHAAKPEDNPFETNFAGLGLSKNMKVFLIVVVSIFGTMETWMYCKAIWRWWKGGAEDKAAAAQE
ncbi:N-terminal binuclear Zn cluster-containing/DNA binding domain-containing protein [Purpureocillium lavendulum]|uniref:N-terminal binuclear Zn cluster-containing/DNA binding domain-containing protein n=1 Tax=Purpureocillium lavendulum TaxID=1247861 RepID=A0AB34FK03_9HYPO|nr:N-terminal binuclear Zn cluster-containing/DNA binding domain-containing protein [Purpureocillium lavendulum]